MKGTIKLSETLTTVKERAFYGREKISAIIMPKSVTKIEQYAFSTCDALTTVFLCEGAYWSNITISNSYNDPIKNALQFAFSATAPAYGGKYWHYDTDGVTPVLW